MTSVPLHNINRAQQNTRHEKHIVTGLLASLLYGVFSRAQAATPRSLTSLHNDQEPS